MLLAPLVGMCIWCVWMVHAFNLHQPYGHNLLRAAKIAFTAPNLQSLTFESLLLGLGVSGLCTLAAYRLGNPLHHKRNFVRGSEFIEQGELARYTRRSKPTGGKTQTEFITLAQVPIPAHIERLHFLIGGTTQSGKTVTIT